MSQTRTPPCSPLGALWLRTTGQTTRLALSRAFQVLWYASILAFSYVVLEAHITESFLYEGF